MEQTSEASYLATYLPDAVVRRFRFSPVAGPEIEELEAAVLFADISGFTPLAEALYREHQQEGNEILTLAINEVFDCVVKCTHEWEGEVVNFVGDAVIIAWPVVKGKRTLIQCSQLAARCALEMCHQREDANYDLHLKIGVAVGSLVEVVVGGVSGRWQYFLAGDPLNEAFGAEGAAEPNHVIISNQLLTILQDNGCAPKVVRVKTDKPDVHVVRLKSVRDNPAMRTGLNELRVLEHQDLDSTLIPSFRGFVPTPVLAELEVKGMAAVTGRDAWSLGELRTVTVCFIQLPTLACNFKTDSKDKLDDINMVLMEMQEIVHKYQGMIRQFVIDDKGSVLIVVFGCPGAAHEDDSFRAIMVAQTIQKHLRELKRTVKNPDGETRDVSCAQMCSIGITTGSAFCGIVGQHANKGNQGRRDYAIVGDVVNLSARLMSKAGLGVILCDEETHKATEHRVQYKKLPKIKVKGKVDPINIYQPAGRNVTGRDKKMGARRISDMDDNGVMVGRGAEAEVLQQKIAKLMNGDGGGFVVIEGEQGIGKSRLVGSLVQHASFNELPYVNVYGDRVERNTPLFMWSNILNTLLADSWLEVYPRKEAPPDSNSLSPPPLKFVMLSSDTSSNPRSPVPGSIPRIPSFGRRRSLITSATVVPDIDDDDDDNEIDSLETPRSGSDKENNLSVPVKKALQLPPLTAADDRQLPPLTAADDRPQVPAFDLANFPNGGGALGDESEFKPRPSLTKHLNQMMLETPRKYGSAVDDSEEIRNGQMRLGDDADQLLPLLVALLGQASDDNVTVSGLSRMAATKSVILKILESFVDQKNPLVLIFEDVQSMDSSSVELLASECEKLLPHCLFVLTCRVEELPQSPHVGASMGKIKARRDTNVVRLGPMNDAAISAVIAHHFNATSVPDELVDAVACKAAGNPYLCQQTAEHLRTLNVVEVVDKEVVVTSDDLRTVVERDVPSSVEQIVRSHVDALPGELQLLVKVASVLSTACPFFTIHLLTFLHPDSPSRDVIVKQMVELVKTGFVKVVDETDAYKSRLLRVISPPEIEGATLCYTFAATTSQQVAYQMMLFQQRKILHTKLVDLYESLLSDTRQRFGPTLHPSLALHYQKAHMWQEAIAFFEKAASRALAKRAARAAGELLHEILEIHDRHKSEITCDSWKVASWHRQFAEALSWNGEHERAHSHFFKALSAIDIVVKERTSQRKNSIPNMHIHVPKRKRGDEKALEAAHCYWGLYNLNVNRLHNREEAIFVASRLESVTHSLDDMWKFISQAVSCNAALLGSSSRDYAVNLGKVALNSLEKLKNHEDPDLLESALLLARSLMATCSWDELDKVLTLATVQAACHKRKRLQSLYLRGQYYHSTGRYKDAQEVFNSILVQAEDGTFIALVIHTRCALVSVHVRLGETAIAYDHFCFAAQALKRVSPAQYLDTRFDVAAAGSLALTALNSIENAITYLGICFRWCAETQQPFHMFQYLSLNQLSEATLNVFWAMEGCYQLNPECEDDPCFPDLFTKLMAREELSNTIRISSLRLKENTERKSDGRMMLTRSASRQSRSSLTAPPPSKPQHEAHRYGKLDKLMSKSRSMLKLVSDHRPHPFRRQQENGKSQLEMMDYQPSSLTQEAVLEWLGLLASCTSSLLLNFGACFRIFRPGSWMSRGVYKIIKAGSLPEGTSAARQTHRGIKCLLRSTYYSERYGMQLVEAQGHILLAWLQQLQGNQKCDNVEKHIRAAVICLQCTQGENYTWHQLQGLIGDLGIIVREGTDNDEEEEEAIPNRSGITA